MKNPFDNYVTRNNKLGNSNFRQTAKMENGNGNLDCRVSSSPAVERLSRQQSHQSNEVLSLLSVVHQGKNKETLNATN